MTVIPAEGKWQEDDWEFKVILSYMESSRPGLKKKKKAKKK